MALSQKGANYHNQDALQRHDRILGDALDDLASQIHAVRSQGNFGQAGPPAPPHPVTSIAVTSSGGFATVRLSHNAAPAGSQYVIQYASKADFSDAIEIDNGSSLSFHRYLKGLSLYIRAATKFPSSPRSPWIYYGSSATPAAVTF